MMLRGEQVLGQAVSDPPITSARGRAGLLHAEVLAGSVTLARFGLIGIALALQTIVLAAPGHFRPASGLFFSLLSPFGTLASLALCLLATFPLRPLLNLRIRRGLAATAILSLVVLAAFGTSRAVDGVSSVLQGKPYSNDGAAMDLYAAHQLLHRHNPYLKTDIVAALAAIDAPATTTTPLIEGQFRGDRAYPSDTAITSVFLSELIHQPRSVPPEFESKYNYPSGSILVILPFAWLGMHDMRFLYALAILAMGWYLAAKLPRAYRPLVALLLLADVPLVSLTAGGQPDPLYGLLLLIGYAEWRRRWVSPLALGLAIATKQLAWFFLPFYILLIARQFRWREAVRRTGLMTAVFLILNGPFIVQSPSSYVDAIAGPMNDPMFPLGIGIIALFVSGVLPMLPKLVFTLAEIGSWIGGLIGTARYRLPPASVAVFAALPLFFAWRSLVNYFYLVPLLALAITIAEQRLAASRA